MIDDLTIATYVLAGFTGVLALATAIYAHYTKRQVKLLEIGHELMKRDIAVKALQAWATNPAGYFAEKDLEGKVELLGLNKLGTKDKKNKK